MNIATSLPISQTVSPTLISGNPEIAIISPASASFISILLRPIKPNISPLVKDKETFSTPLIFP